jgi:glycosyltransferase involved in cell wall biosynthesis
MHAEFDFDRRFAVVPPFLPDAEGGASAREITPAAAPSGSAYFLYVGRLEKIKGLHEVIPSFVRDGASELWVAGSGSYESHLRELAGPSRRVRFLGHQTGERLGQLYRHAIAVVVPSVCYEVFPMVVLEAFREGTPIVAHRVGPFPEIVERSGGGLLYSTAGELDRALLSLTADKALRERLGRAAAHAFKTLWSEPVAMNKYFDVIRDVAKRRGLDLILQRTEPD